MSIIFPFLKPKILLKSRRFQDSRIPRFQDSRFHVLQLTESGLCFNLEPLKGITKHRVGLEFKFKFELDFELQFESILSVVTTISDTLRILQATCLTVRFISDALEYLVNQVEIKHQS